MVKRIFARIFQIAVTPSASVAGAASILTVSILLSRVLGLVRYRLLAAEFGDSIILLDSFLAASQVPEIIFEVLIFGSITVAFIPVFSQLLARGAEQKAWKLAQTLINSGLILFFFLAIILLVTSEQIAYLVAPGLIAENPEIGGVISNLVKVMVVAQLFFLLGIFATGILQSYKNFLVPALAPAVYNLGIIFGIVFLSAPFGIFGPALGMVMGAGIFFIMQFVIIARLGSMFDIKIDFSQPEAKKVLQLAWPRIVGLSAARGIDWINIALASLTGAGSIVAFNFAQILILVPVGLFGSSVAQAALPTLSYQFAKKDLASFKKTFISSIHQIFFLTLPAISFLTILRIPAVRLVFGAANFPWETTLLAGRILIILAIGITAQASLLLLVRAFYALGDAKTPITAGLVSFGFNVVLAFTFIMILKHGVIYLAAAFTFSAILYFLTLIYFLDKKIGGFNWQTLITPAVKMLVAAIAAAGVMYLPFKILDLLLDTSRTLNVLILTFVAGFSGLSTYLVFNLILGVHQAKMIHNFFARLKFPRRILTTETISPPRG